MVIDTDVLIDYFRGYESAKKRLEILENRMISMVSLYELYQGARNKKELEVIRSMLREWEFEIIAVNEEQSYQTLFIMEKYSMSHGLKMADAMIATCGIYRGVPILTGNHSDYRFISELSVIPYKR